MHLLETLYRSPFGRILSAVGHALAIFINKPFMVYGLVDPKTRLFRKFTRMSSTSIIMNKKNLTVGDHVWIWHYSILDATEGLIIEEGCQIGAWVGIFTHGSENSIRLLGSKFVHQAKCGWVGEPGNMDWLAKTMKMASELQKHDIDMIGQRGRQFGFHHFSKSEGVRRLAGLILEDG